MPLPGWMPASDWSVLRQTGFCWSPAQALRRCGIVINDYAALRGLFAGLLAEIQRIKSCGDYEAARDMVERYGKYIDRRLHEEIYERYRSLDLAPYKGFINPRLVLVRDEEGSVTDIVPDYTEGYAEQMLRYSRDYSTLI